MDNFWFVLAYTEFAYMVGLWLGNKVGRRSLAKELDEILKREDK